jgi:hypothetical protein
MSLEVEIAKLTAAVEANSTLLEKLVARAVEAGAVAAPAAADKAETKKRTSKKDDKAEEKTEETGTTEASGPSHDEVKSLVSAWLGEFKGVEGDGETEARKAAIRAALASLTKKEGAQIADVPADQLHRVVAWLDKKKSADAGFGVGRLTEQPGAKKEEAPADDDI